MDGAAEVCQRCGFRMVAPPQPDAQEQKNPMIAGVASLLPGLGHFYIGETRRGIVLIVIAVFLLYLVLGFHNIVAELGDALYVVIVLYSAYDSYNTAKMMNEGLT
jgi:TM2 domain-containing membrane protein YozV